MDNKIYLYGEIGRWSACNAKDIIAKLKEASLTNNFIELHIHTPGGEVIEGNLIYNAIRNNKVPVHVYIDGMAASMGSIIALAGDKILMSENAFIMIHKPSGSVWGTATDFENSAKQLRAIEKQFVKVLKTRMDKSDDDIAKMFEGDNWFSAEEALNIGLIDEITDKIIDEQPIDKSDIRGMYNSYSALLDNKNNKKEMDKQDNNQTADLQAKLAEAQKTIADLQAKEEQAKKDAIAEMVDTAVKDGRITAEQRKDFIAVGETSGIDVLKKIIPAKVAETITEQLKATAQTATMAASRKDWDFDKWQEEDPRGLEAMQKDNNEAFMALYNAKFN